MSERKCPSCLAVLGTDGIAFCPHCGARLDGAPPVGTPRVNVDGVLRRAEMALADGAFDRVHAFCETALNEDPECATAYLYHLLAELKLRDRASLANAAILFDESDHYKKAFRFGDEALRKELLDALYAIDAREREKGRAAAYERAVAALAAAEDIPACLEAEKMFLSLGEYRDAPLQAENCRARCEVLHAKWEAQKEQKRLAAIERKKRSKKILIIAFAALLLVLVLIVAVVWVLRVHLPNSMREDALAMMERGDYYDALDLLAEAKEQALFEGTRDTISETEEYVKKSLAEHKKAVKAEEERLAAEQAHARKISMALYRAEALLQEGAYLDAFREMLAVNVPVCLSYDAEDAKLRIGKKIITDDVWYRDEEPLPDIATATRTAYTFERWVPASHYDETAQVYYVTLRAEFTAVEYRILYVLDGGTSDNPECFDSTTPTFTLTPPVRRGYTFLGWTGTGIESLTTEVTIPTGSFGQRSYTAHWRANTYHVTLDAAGGSISVYEITPTFGKGVSLPTPLRLGYRFLGWYHEDTLASTSAWNIEGDVTVTAKWAPLDYTITYHLDGVKTSHPNPKSYTIESGTIALENPYYSWDYVFLGWYADAAYTQRVYAIHQGTTGPIELYAKWAPR